MPVRGACHLSLALLTFAKAADPGPGHPSALENIPIGNSEREWRGPPPEARPSCLGANAFLPALPQDQAKAWARRRRGVYQEVVLTRESTGVLQEVPGNAVQPSAGWPLSRHELPAPHWTMRESQHSPQWGRLLSKMAFQSSAQECSLRRGGFSCR